MENEIPDNELPQNELPDKKLPENELPKELSGNELPGNELPTPTQPEENADALQSLPTPPENSEEQAAIFQEEDDRQINKTIRRRTFLSFGAFAVLYTLGIVGWRALRNQPKADEVFKPLRKVLNGNEKVNAKFFSDHHLAKEYPKEEALTEPRTNGDVGIDEDFDLDSWSLVVERNAGSKPLELKLDEIKSLPKKEIVFDFKCIEGWSMITYWGGTKFSDFLIHYKLGTRSGNAPDPAHPEDLYKYVGLKTPDEKYYVGVDMKSIMHPQTLLCYDLNDSPLSVEHGYPLRLIIPVKYGVKNLKCVGTIFFSDTRPPDYWFEQGYDYDCAL